MLQNSLKSLHFNLVKRFPRRYSSTTIESDGNQHFDIVVAGSGMVGSTLACALGKNKKLALKKILLLGASAAKAKYSVPTKYGNRVSALNPATYNLLNDIGVWQHIQAQRFGTVQQMQVWDALSPAIITFDNDVTSEPVAYVVENDLLLASVDEELCSINERVERRSNSNVNGFTKNADGTIQVHLDDGQNVSCALLLGCDGANSKIRQAMNISYISWNYKQCGIVATLELSQQIIGENVIAWQRFLPDGTIALLPLNEKLSSLVWCTTSTQAENLMSLSDTEFVTAINCALFKHLPQSEVINGISRVVDGCVKVLGLPSNITGQCPPEVFKCEEKSRAVFPLGFGHAATYIQEGVALVGDAAHRVHPLAGQGVNLGFGDVDCLNRTIGDMVFSGSKLNNVDYLRRYERDRQRHNVSTMLAIEGLQKLYNCDWKPVVLARTLGLQVTHALSPLKRAIISHAAS